MLGCATFHNILKPAAMLCKALQRDEICLVSAVEAVLRSTDALEKLKTKQVTEFPSVRKVMLRLNSVDEGKTYQGFELTYYEKGLDFVKAHYLEYIDTVLTCMCKRMKPEDNTESDVLNHAIKILATHGWEKCEDSSFAHESICFLITRFTIPLQDAGINTASICGEWDDIVQYSKQYIDLVRISYAHVWWKLYNCPDTPK